MLENCLQAFESFVLRCPKEIGPHVDGIVTIALKFIKYDPNYADEDDDDDEDMEQVYVTRMLISSLQLKFFTYRTTKKLMNSAMMVITMETMIIRGRCVGLLVVKQKEHNSPPSTGS